MHKHGTPLLFASLVTSVSAQSCRFQFDGRVPPSFGVAGFDTPNNFFSETNVLGAGLSFSQLIQLPAISASLVRSSIPNLLLMRAKDTNQEAVRH